MTDRKPKRTQMGVNTVSAVTMAGSETLRWEDARGCSDGGVCHFFEICSIN